MPVLHAPMSSPVSLMADFEEVKLTYRHRVKAAERPSVTKSSSAYKLILENWDMSQIDLREEFKILLLDRTNKAMSIASISQGGAHYTVVDPKMIFAIALKRRASSIILVHNHPSGGLVPSVQDRKLTDRLTQAGALLDINVVDHLIVTRDDYISFSDEGIMPSISSAAHGCAI